MHGGISKKKSCGMFTYDNLNFKPQILSIFYFDRASDGRMAHVIDVKWLFFQSIKEATWFHSFACFIWTSCSRTNINVTQICSNIPSQSYNPLRAGVNIVFESQQVHAGLVFSKFGLFWLSFIQHTCTLFTYILQSNVAKRESTIYGWVFQCPPKTVSSHKWLKTDPYSKLIYP